MARRTLCAMGIPQQAEATRRPVDTVTDNAAVTLLHFGSTVVATAGTAKVLTIPLDLWGDFTDECDGMSFDVIQEGAGAFSIAGAGGVTVTAVGGLVATNGLHAKITVTCLSANSYSVSGDRA